MDASTSGRTSCGLSNGPPFFSRWQAVRTQRIQVFPERGYDTRNRSPARIDAFTSGENAKNPASGGRISESEITTNLEPQIRAAYNAPMLNYIWLGLILLAVALGGAAGGLDKVTAAAFKA